MFTFFLCMLQLALAYVVGLAVRRSASAASRAAVVILDDDPRAYEDQVRMGFPTEDDTSCGDSFFSDLGGLLGGGGNADDSPLGAMAALLSSDAPTPEANSCRFRAIHNAASVVMLPFSPSGRLVTSPPSVNTAFGGDPWTGSHSLDRLAMAILYNRRMLAVTFPETPGANTYRNTFGARSNVTVRVTYPFHCAIPIADRIMCESALVWYGGEDGVNQERLARAGRALNNGQISAIEFAGVLAEQDPSNNPLASDRAREIHQRSETSLARFRASQVERDDMRLYSSGWKLFEVLSTMAQINAAASIFGDAPLPTPRFMLLSSEATLPIQSAPYAYPAGESDEEEPE